MKVSTVILLMLPCEILIFSSILLPSEYIDYAIAFIMFYIAGVLFIIAKYILRGDNAHLISGISISYEEAKLPENIEKYAKENRENFANNWCLLPTRWII